MTKPRRAAQRHGYVIIDKPPGWTSHDVVSQVRRIVGERRVGHAGTLDPAAVGVLPVAVGLATRTVEYLTEASKSYRAWVTFGVVTDSADGDGKVIAIDDPSGLDLETLRALVLSFTGEQMQRPPMHSAIKMNGQRLYRLAHAGIDVAVPPRLVRIRSIEVVDWSPPTMCLDIDCSKGTYIRALARDLGEAAGPGAYLSRLVRTRTGPFGLDDALSLDDLTIRLQDSTWDLVSFHPDWVLGHLSAIVLGHDQRVAWGHGKPISLDALLRPTATVRAYDADGTWLGVGVFDTDTQSVKPVKVIAMETLTP